MVCNTYQVMIAHSTALDNVLHSILQLMCTTYSVIFSYCIVLDKKLHGNSKLVCTTYWEIIAYATILDDVLHGTFQLMWTTYHVYYTVLDNELPFTTAVYHLLCNNGTLLFPTTYCMFPYDRCVPLTV